jgi:hypothetical protein
MRRKDPARRSTILRWRARAVTLALIGTGLATALATAQMATKPDDAEMSRAITRQQVGGGQPPAAVAGGRNSGPMTQDQMLTGAETYASEMNRTIEHGENSRVSAYRSKDIIRMTCVDDKLGQMKQVLIIAKPRFETIKLLTADEFHMRAQFTIIREGAERIRILADEMDNCTGDALDHIGVARINEEGAPSDSIVDPTLPANPTLDVARPEQASPYN